MTIRAEPAVGIDLGTTFSVLARLDADGRPRTVSNAEGESLTPSAVFFDRDAPVVGREALRAADFEPRRVARFAKRDVGQRHFGKSICGCAFPPEVIESLVLAKLKQDAELTLGEFSKAVVTVPAHFNEPRRKATQDAGRLAGLDVIDIINEPTAAAIAYGLEHRFLAPDGAARAHERVLVYDLGGGTFDVTLMDIDRLDFRAVAIAGDVRLGGIDWDERIARRAAEAFRTEHDVDLCELPDEWERLMQAASDAKHALTSRMETTISIAHDGRQTRLRLTRADFEALTGDLLERTRLTCRDLLNEAGIAWRDVTRLLLVGGATRMPMIQQMLADESGRQPDRSLSPDEAVAHGAAVYAGWVLQHDRPGLRGLSVRNVNSHALGVLGVDLETLLRRRKVMIARHTPLPAAVIRRFQTSKQGQRDVVIPVVEGGTDTGEGCTQIGRLLVTDLPPDLPVGTPIDVGFRYGRDGRLTIHATLAAAGREAQVTLWRAAGMSEDAIAQWSAQMSAGLAVPDVARSAPAEPSDHAATPGEPSPALLAFAADDSDHAAAPDEQADAGVDESLAAFLRGPRD